MILLVINDNNDIVQTISGDEGLLRVNATAFENQGFRCMYAEQVPYRANKIVDNEPVRVDLGESAEYKRMVIRQERNQYLSLCDWTQMPDAPLTQEQKQAWAAYRQALRDFPETCDPDNPVWPEPPR